MQIDEHTPNRLSYSHEHIKFLDVQICLNEKQRRSRCANILVPSLGPLFLGHLQVIPLQSASLLLIGLVQPTPL